MFPAFSIARKIEARRRGIVRCSFPKTKINSSLVHCQVYTDRRENTIQEISIKKIGLKLTHACFFFSVETSHKKLWQLSSLLIQKERQKLLNLKNDSQPLANLRYDKRHLPSELVFTSEACK